MYQGIGKDTELFEGETAPGSLFMNRVLSLNQLLQSCHRLFYLVNVNIMLFFVPDTESMDPTENL